MKFSLVFGLGVLSFACSAGTAKLPPGQALIARDADRVALNANSGKVFPNGNAGGDQAGVHTPNLHVSSQIAQLCGLPDPRSAPRFDFDMTQLSPEDRDVLAALAKCMSDGPLRGRNVALIGRTDPRGEMEYNMTLGEARADSVRRYLRDLGIPLDRVGASSRGEIDATGNDEIGWSLDRRVDIQLASM